MQQVLRNPKSSSKQEMSGKRRAAGAWSLGCWSLNAAGGAAGRWRQAAAANRPVSVIASLGVQLMPLQKLRDSCRAKPVALQQTLKLPCAAPAVTGCPASHLAAASLSAAQHNVQACLAPRGVRGGPYLAHQTLCST